MLTSIAINSINHILSRESWAYKHLQVSAGKKACIRIAPILALNIIIDENGLIQNASRHTIFDTTLNTTLSALMQAYNSKQSIYRYIKISGDHDFAAKLINIIKNIHFDFEQDLSHCIGDIPAHRAIQMSTKLLTWHKQSFYNITQAIAEYWTEENPELAKHHKASRLSDEIKVLSTKTEQLEYKIIQLMHKALP